MLSVSLFGNITGCYWKNDRGKFNPALFARLADGDGVGLIERCQALR
jgi:hypothetical protein